MRKTYKRKILPWQSIDNKTLILHSEKGEVHELNATGTFLWLKIESKKSVDELIDIFAQSGREVTSTTKQDFELFLNNLSLKDLVDCHE